MKTPAVPADRTHRARNLFRSCHSTFFRCVTSSIHGIHAKFFPAAHSSQVPAITLFNLLYRRLSAPRSTSFHQKSPDHNSRSERRERGSKLVAGLGSQIPPIPLNSTY